VNRLKRGKSALIAFALVFFLVASLFCSPEVGPSFNLYDLTIDPDEVLYGSPVTVSVVVGNAGDESGEYEIVLMVDGTPRETKGIMLAASTSETVSFELNEDVGIHNVAIAGLTGTFDVKPEPVVEPEPEPEPVPQFLTITTSWLPQADTGEAYECKLEASGGSPPYTWKWDMPKTVESVIHQYGPKGLDPSFDVNARWSGISLKPDGTIYGKLVLAAQVPSNVTAYRLEKQVVITVKDSEGDSASKQFAFTFSYVR
jgi:hypothetical protein